jgi:hypothetical protein
MLPKYVVDFLIDFFGAKNAALIAQNWYKFSQISLSSSSREDFIFEGKVILQLVKSA